MAATSHLTHEQRDKLLDFLYASDITWLVYNLIQYMPDDVLNSLVEEAADDEE